MKEKFNSFTPFFQATLLFLIGAVTFMLISMISSIAIGILYPELPSNDINIQLNQYPVQYMLIHFLPFQLGFLLTPGLIYLKLGKSREQIVRKKQFKFIIWSFLLFVSAFLLLPFFSQINLEIIKVFGIYDELVLQKEDSDRQLTKLVGSVGSQSYYVALLLIGIVTGISEELAFRRFLMHHMLKNNKNVVLSILLSAGIFAVLHFNYIQILPLFSFGIALGLMYYVSGSIVPGIIVHALNNMLNIYWLATDNFPDWMMEIDLKTTIPSTLLLMGLIIYYLQKK
ncbi:MAG TPA: CPBP family intramembrane glutamic endopeptidase [Brumimicrobium sp.]|nr:CPBP family intramembrane glutamic endopeptidase [Brumimicrobium sp.]